eukprot:7247711-Pyramimonas_sp.AAC.1
MCPESAGIGATKRALRWRYPHELASTGRRSPSRSAPPVGCPGKRGALAGMTMPPHGIRK